MTQIPLRMSLAIGYLAHTSQSPSQPTKGTSKEGERYVFHDI